VVTDDDIKRLRTDANAWLFRANGERVTRDTAINEESMALDVVDACDEIERLKGIVVNAQAAVYSFAETVRSAVEAHKRRGQGGQQVSFHGDFANAMPSVLVRLEWWVRHLSLFVGQTAEKPEVVRERDEALQRLAEMTAARNQACDIARYEASGERDSSKAHLVRIAQLRAISTKEGK
jgi:hypothetical protein